MRDEQPRRNVPRFTVVSMSGIVVAQVLMFALGILPFPRLVAFVAVMDVILTAIVWIVVTGIENARHPKR